MANDFLLADDPSGNDQVEDMHLRLTLGMSEYFVSVRGLIDTAGLADIDPYGDTVWSPVEASAMVERLQRTYDEVVTLWPREGPGDWEPPPGVGRVGVVNFLFWLRRLFMEAAARQKYVIAGGD